MTIRELIKLLLDAGNLDCEIYVVGKEEHIQKKIEKVYTDGAYSSTYRYAHIKFKD